MFDRFTDPIRGEVVELSLSAAGKVLERQVAGADDRRIVEELVSTHGVGKN